MTDASTTNKRVPVPKAVREAVLKEFNYRCAICGSDKPQVHHMDKDPSNNDSSNLIPLCPNCHLSDQHDPTRQVEPERLRLFRRYRDPYILLPAFVPLFRRMAILWEIDKYTNPFDCQDDAEEIRRLGKSSRDLTMFLEQLEMGSYYASKVRELIGYKDQVHEMITDEANMELAKKSRRKDATRYREDVLNNRGEAEVLIVEMLRYQHTWQLRKQP